MVDLMKFEDPFSPPGDQPDLNKLRRTKQPPFCPWENACCVSLFAAGSAPPWRGQGQSTEIPPGRGVGVGVGTSPCLCPQWGLGALYWCCRLGEREAEPGLEGRELPLGACRAWGSSCGPGPGSPGPDSSLLSSLWLLCCSGHSKWTQWNTSFAVLCVPTIRMKEAGCLSKVTDCQDLQETLVLSATMVHCCWLVETST